MSTQAILRELFGTSILEVVGVVTALLYLILATARSQWCWLSAFISSVCYVVVMWQANLVMDTWLNLFYVAMAVYGYWQWGRSQSRDGELLIVSWGWKAHVLAIASVLLVSALNAWVLEVYFPAARSPWLDSLVTWGSVLTTFMVARRVMENWLYWIVVDGLAAYLYYTRGLSATAGLFVVYVVMVIYGYIAWRRQVRMARAAATPITTTLAP